MERRQIEVGQAIDARDLVARADLDQAELRVVRLLADELRVDGRNRSVLERGDEARERRVVRRSSQFRCAAANRRSSWPEARAALTLSSRSVEPETVPSAAPDLRVRRDHAASAWAEHLPVLAISVLGSARAVHRRRRLFRSSLAGRRDGPLRVRREPARDGTRHRFIWACSARSIGNARFRQTMTALLGADALLTLLQALLVRRWLARCRAPVHRARRYPAGVLFLLIPHLVDRHQRVRVRPRSRAARICSVWPSCSATCCSRSLQITLFPPAPDARPHPRHLRNLHGRHRRHREGPRAMRSPAPTRTSIRR